jgi:hypothetical protein
LSFNDGDRILKQANASVDPNHSVVRTEHLQQVGLDIQTPALWHSRDLRQPTRTPWVWYPAD